MLRRVGRFLVRMLPALVVAVSWLAWWVVPERPLRSCPLGISAYAEIIRPTNGQWAVFGSQAKPDEYGSALRFDPVRGSLEKLLTPHRHHYNVSLDASRWAWSDDFGSIHFATLPDNRELFVTPRDPDNQIVKLAISPDRQWMLSENWARNSLEIWDVKSGEKAANLDGGSLGLATWGFRTDGGLRVLWNDKVRGLVRMCVYRLPNAAAEIAVDIPCAPQQKAGLGWRDSYLVISRDGTPEEFWDTSSAPPRLCPRSEWAIPHIVSPDGRYRMTFDCVNSDNGSMSVDNVRTGEVMFTWPDSRSQFLDVQGMSYGPSFSPDGRLVVLCRGHVPSSLPAWTPRWCRIWWRSHGTNEESSSIILCDPTTGRELRAFNGCKLVQIPPDGKTAWIARRTMTDTSTVSALRDTLTVLEEYPIAAPRPPWRLWALTAVGIGWYVHRFRRWRSARRSSRITPAPCLTKA